MGLLSGATVALTRARGRNGPLAEELRAAGAEIAEVPLISTGPPRDGGAELRRALDQLRPGSWLVLSSATAIAPLLAVLGSAEALDEVAVAAIGPATAAALRSAGIDVGLVGDGGGGASLAEVLLARVGPGAHVVLAQAESPSPELGILLRRGGADVDEVAAYATVPRVPEPGELDSLLSADLVVLASPSAASTLAAVLDAASRPRSVTRIVAFGATTGAAARRLGFVDVTEAERPEVGGLLEAVATSWSSRAGSA
jgi:uroporphyrinogen-III synthase